MANVSLPARTWVNLYAATGIVVGTQIEVVNLTPNSVRLAATLAQPTVNDDHLPLEFRTTKGINDAGDAGAWALCVAGGGVDVKEVV
jgi:hypothetical protein